MPDVINNVPLNLGFSMPAEWSLHAATWTCWPFDEENWFGHLPEVRKEFEELVSVISAYEPVNLIVASQEAEIDAKARFKNNSKVTIHNVLLNDIWFRDNGPIFIKQDKNVSFVKWQFNAWGQKFKWDLDTIAPNYVAQYLNAPFFETSVVMEGGSLDVNGNGVALTTKQCLLSKMRNPNLTQIDIEQYLKSYLGINKLIWLENGLEGDHTDGHIDTIVRFVNANTIVYSIAEDQNDLNYVTMKQNLEILKKATDVSGNFFNLVPLILPKNKMKIEGKRLPCTYANFYIGNGFVVVPTYDDPNDANALKTLETVFPEHKVIGLKSKYIISGGGSFHCVTQQQPAGQIWRP